MIFSIEVLHIFFVVVKVIAIFKCTRKRYLFLFLATTSKVIHFCMCRLPKYYAKLSSNPGVCGFSSRKITYEESNFLLSKPHHRFSLVSQSRLRARWSHGRGSTSDPSLLDAVLTVGFW